MTTGYQYRSITNFDSLGLRNVGDEWASNHQKSLGIPQDDDTEYSYLKFLGLSDHPDFYKIFVRHETIRNQKARFDNVIRDNFIGIEEFHLYVPLNFSYFYADTSTRLCNELLRRIKQSKGQFEYTLRVVDLIKIKELFLSQIRGGWFKELEIVDVSAAAIFGSSVGDSDDWARYESYGHISALTLEFTYKGAKHSVQITRNGTIVVFQNFKENYVISLIESINEVVTKFSEDVKFEPGSKRKG